MGNYSDVMIRNLKEDHKRIINFLDKEIERLENIKKNFEKDLEALNE